MFGIWTSDLTLRVTGNEGGASVWHPVMYSAAVLLLVFGLPLMGGAPLIHSVQVEGTSRPFDLVTKAGEPMDPDHLSQDVRMIWKTGSFDDVQVEQTDTELGPDITFHVTEKPRVYLRKVEFSERTPKRNVTLPPGSTIDPLTAHELAKKVERQLHEEGYAHGRVRAELLPAGYRQADLRLDVDAGDRYRVWKVEFTGDLGVTAEELEKSLSATRVKRILGGIWKSRPVYSQEAVDGDLHRLRSVYTAHGYFDARVGFGGLEYRGDLVKLTYCVDAGKKYDVRMVEVDGKPIPVGPDREFPVKQVCKCLLDARRQADREGHIDFDVKLQVKDVEPRVADVTADIETGEAFSVGRINFVGNHSFSDATLRKALVLDEGAPFDQTLLGRSIVRLNRLGILEPLTEKNVRVLRDPLTKQVRVDVAVKETRPGRWSFSGPIGTFGMGGPLQGAVMSRLPSWGRGVFEASTYVVSVSLIGFGNPWAKFLPFMKRTEWMPYIRLDRPFLEGQGWKSGFTIAPQFGWQGMLASYGMTQVQGRLRNALLGDTPAPAPIFIPVTHSSLNQRETTLVPNVAGTLICEQKASRWNMVRTGAVTAVELFLFARPF